MTILTFKQFKQEYGLSDRLARRVLSSEGCPLFPRQKNQSYLIPKEAFEKWYDEDFIRRNK